jgi:hypothetical protein
MFLLRTIAAAVLLGGAIAAALAFALRRGATLGRIAIDGAASIVGGFAGGALFVPLAAAFPHSRSGGQIGDWSGLAYAAVTGAFLGATAGIVIVEAIRAGVSWRSAVSILGGVALGGLLIFAAIHVKGPGSSEYDGVMLVLGAVAIGVLGASGAMAGSGHR